MVRQPSFRDASNLFALATAVVVVATLYIARAVLVPLALAILFTFLFAPVVTCLERIRLGRVPSAAFVVLAAISVLGAFGWTVTRQIIDVTNQLPDYRTNIQAKIASIHSSRSENLRKASDAVKQLEKDITDDPAAAKRARAKTPPSTTQKPIPVQVVDNGSRLPALPQLIGGFLRAGLVIVFTFFMLIQREDLRNRFIRLAGADRLTRMTQALDEAGRRVSHYLLLQLMVNITYGSIIGVVLYFIGIPNALLWGAIAGLLRFLPYVGPPLGALCPTVLAFIIFDEWTRPLITIGLFIILEILVAYFAEPTLYGAHTGVTPIAILVAAVFWSMLWGPIGLLLSTPLTVCLVVIGRHMPHLKFLQILLGDAPALPPEARFYQRLLATDEDEARQILESDFKDKPLRELYDTVLIPSLQLVEQDRHRAILDDETEKFIFQTTKELVEEQFERSQTAEQEATTDEAQSSAGSRDFANAQASPSSDYKVLCVPARDEADEISGTMLAQLLQQNGYLAQCLPLNDATELLDQVSRMKPAVVCISALPPLALAYARTLYRRLHEQFPTAKVVVGLWTFSGDRERIARRIGISPGNVASTLEEAIQQIRAATETLPVREDSKQSVQV
jgi:predicted PurR-regulated permease PerM